MYRQKYRYTGFCEIQIPNTDVFCFLDLTARHLWRNITCSNCALACRCPSDFPFHKYIDCAHALLNAFDSNLVPLIIYTRCPSISDRVCVRVRVCVLCVQMMAVCDMFVCVCEALKTLTHRTVVDFTCSITKVE